MLLYDLPHQPTTNEERVGLDAFWIDEKRVETITRRNFPGDGVNSIHESVVHMYSGQAITFKNLDVAELADLLQLK